MSPLQEARSTRLPGQERRLISPLGEGGVGRWHREGGAQDNTVSIAARETEAARCRSTDSTREDLAFYRERGLPTPPV